MPGQLGRLLQGATFTSAPNSGYRLWSPLEPFEKRREGSSENRVPRSQAALLQKLSAIQEGLVSGHSSAAPSAASALPVGSAMMVEGPAPGRGTGGASGRSVWHDGSRPRRAPGVRQGPSSLFESSTPQAFTSDIDRTKAARCSAIKRARRVQCAAGPISALTIVNRLQILLGRTFRVTAQAEDTFRLDPQGTYSRSGFAIRAGTPCRSARSPP